MSHQNDSFTPQFNLIVDESSYDFDYPVSNLDVSIAQPWMPSPSHSAQHQVHSPAVSVQTILTNPDLGSFRRLNAHQTRRSPVENNIDPNLPNFSLLTPTGHFAPSTYSTLERHLQDQPWSAGNLRSTNTAIGRSSFNHSNVPYGIYRRGPGSDIDSHVVASDSGYHSQPPQSVFSNEPSRSSQEIPSSIALKVNNLNVEPNTSEALAMLRTSSDQASQTSSRSGKSGKSFRCSECGEMAKCKSDLKKHKLKHDRPFRCDMPNCKWAKQGGFTTVNDLDRHRKSVHRIGLRSKSYQCASENCRNKEKIWPRLDNFKQHITRMHKDEDEVDLIRRSTYRPIETVPARVSSGVGPMDTSFAVVGMEKSFSSNPALDAARTIDLSVDHDARRWSSLNQNPENFIKDVQQIPSYGNTTIPRSKVSRHRISEGGQGQPYVRKRSSGTVMRRGPQAIPTNATVHAASERSTTENQGQMTNLSLSNAPQTKAEQQKLALQKLSQANKGELKSPSLLGPMNLEDIVFRILCDATDPVQQDRTPSRESLNQKSLLTLTKGGVLKASHLISTIIRQSAGSTSTAQPHLHPGLASNVKVCPKPECKYTVARECDLRKHMKRHERPYGCTYPKCHKRFGAKSDWKRHENSQHFQFEAFRCAQPSIASLKPVCSQLFFHLKKFEDHLQTRHDIFEPEQLKDWVTKCTIGKNYQGSFWCGFCETVIELKERSNAAWDERFDHIARHFEKEGKNIDEWVCVEENKTKKELLPELNPCVFDEEEEKDEDVDAVGETEDDVEMTPRNMPPEQPSVSKTQNVYTPRPQTSQGTTSGKRKRTNVEVQMQHPRKRRITTKLCCQCSAGPWHQPFNLSCIGCSHHLCPDCPEESCYAFVDRDL